MDRTERVYLSGRRFAVVALIAGIGVAGCGSSSSKPKLTKEQFLTQANAICKAGNEKTQAEANKLGSKPTQAQAVNLVTKSFVPEIQGEITAVRALAVQTADKAKLTGIMNLAQSDLDKVKANPALLVSNAQPFKDFAAEAHPYGLTQCASGS